MHEMCETLSIAEREKVITFESIASLCRSLARLANAKKCTEGAKEKMDEWKIISQYTSAPNSLHGARCTHLCLGLGAASGAFLSSSDSASPHPLRVFSPPPLSPPERDGMHSISQIITRLDRLPRLSVSRSVLFSHRSERKSLTLQRRGPNTIGSTFNGLSCYMAAEQKHTHMSRHSKWQDANKEPRRIAKCMH